MTLNEYPPDNMNEMQAIPKKERIYSSLKVRKDRHKEINPVLCQANFELILKIKKSITCRQNPYPVSTYIKRNNAK